MKRIIATLLLFVMLTASTIALAANVKFTGSTHVYKYAGSGKLATVIRKGSVAEKVGTCGKSWTRIKLTDKKGTKVWVRTKYLKDTTAKVNVIYSAGGAGYSTAGKPVSGTLKPGWYTVDSFAKGKKQALRAKPHLSSKSLATVKSGQKVYAMGELKRDSRGVIWAKVKYKGKTGWLSSTLSM